VDGTNVFFYLLSAGATVDARDREGKTALMSAVMLGDSNIIKTKALITAGADVNARNRHGATVLKYAKWAAAGGHPAKTTIDLLEQRGAKE
jgi:ankyrin repeat protein